MAMSDANYQIHFANMGAMVELYNQLETDRAGVITTIEEAIALLKDNEAEVTALAGLLATQKSIDSALQNAKRLVSGNVQVYLLGPVAKGIGFTGASLGLIDVLVALAADMALVPESINGSAVSATAPTYPTANAGTFALSTPASLAQLLATESWVAECMSISAGAGHEVWQVRGEPDLHGVLRSTLTSAVAYTGQDRNLQALFTTTLTPYTAGTGYEIAGDAGGELGATTWTGAVKATNTDSAGDVFLALDLLSETEAGDNNNQLSGWANITGAKLGVNTDATGKLHVNIVDDTGGYFHVDLYKASGKAAGDKVAHTATFNSTGAKALVADNASGIAGTITIDAVTAADTDITCILAFRRLRVYKEMGLSNIVAIGGLVSDAGTVTLVAQNSSGLSGTAVIAYSDGEAKVQIRVGFAVAVGDKAHWTATNDAGGVFSEFFRSLGVALPVDLAAGETILDSLAT